MEIFFIAGFFAGVTKLALVGLYVLFRLYRKTDSERMRLWNKVLVRNGQNVLFTAEEIEGKTQPETEPGKIREMRSPLRAGWKRMRDRLSDDKKHAAGDHMPPEMKTKISDAAKKAQAG